MSNSRRPYRTVDHRLPLQRGPGHPLGFMRTVQAKTAQLTREVAGLVDRLRYRYADGVPAAYKNEVVFRPRSETVSVVVDAAQTVLANVVVPDAVTHSVPVVFEGPGVFCARYMHVEFYQRVWGGDGLGHAGREYRFTIPPSKSFVQFQGAPGSIPGDTAKWSLPLGLVSGSISEDRRDLGVVFFWNLVDRDSGRKLSEDLISHQVLLPGGFQNQVNGNLFEFATPWLFERAGVLDFQFRLTTPILQPDVSSGIFPFDWDDREDNGTRRNMEVVVRCELHGTKFYDDRDALFREAV